MKRYFWLIGLAFCLSLTDAGIAAAAGAAGANTAVAERFQLLVSNDKINTMLDMHTIRYCKDPYRDENLVDAWVKTVERENGGYNLSRYYFRIKERQYQMITSLEFDADGNLISTERNPYSSRFKDVIPETLAEKWYDAAMQYEKDVLAIKK